jgi:hypothetical protein
MRQRCEQVLAQVEAAAQRAGIAPAGITIVAVAKTRPLADVEEIVSLGFTEIGESRVQETQKKYATGKPNCRLHLVGHLQANKASSAVELFDFIQSVDSVSIAREIDRRAEQAGKVMPILLEVNSSGEEQKYGLAPDALADAAAEVMEMEHLRLSGLMTVGPLTDDEAEIRSAFALVRRLFEEVQTSTGKLGDFRYLSMGMSGDFSLAIAEGANLLRIGTALFGPRRT